MPSIRRHRRYGDNHTPPSRYGYGLARPYRYRAKGLTYEQYLRIAGLGTARRPPAPEKVRDA